MLPSVDIIIPHYNGAPLLLGCLETLFATDYPSFEVYVVDNASTDQSIELALSRFPRLQVLRSDINLGYAGGCNFGFGKTAAPYVVFLNNDTEQTPDWLIELVRRAEQSEQIAALQPKILSIQARNLGLRRFDYAGAAGGLIDQLGYPYAYGRVFGAVEEDEGQYDQVTTLFWASGTALFVRRSAVEYTGCFDDDFFAHMEEIDLCWRLQLVGYRIEAVPTSVIFHYGGATLAAGHPQKVLLNHRNNLMMLMKNLSLSRLWYILPLRLMLEVVSMFFYWLKSGSRFARCVFEALLWNMKMVPKTLQKRRAVQAIRTVSDTSIFEHAPFAKVLISVIKGS